MGQTMSLTVTAPAPDSIEADFSFSNGYTTTWSFLLYKTSDGSGNPLAVTPTLTFPGGGANDGSQNFGTAVFTDSSIEANTNYTVIVTTNTYDNPSAGGSVTPPMACLAVGTLITMADGTARAIEALRPGDAVRTHGGDSTLITATMITGAGARPPYVLRAGTAGATADLWLTGILHVGSRLHDRRARHAANSAGGRRRDGGRRPASHALRQSVVGICVAWASSSSVSA